MKELIHIYGKHTVADALKQRPESVVRVYARTRYIDDPAFTKHLAKVETVLIQDDRELPKEIGRDAVHQGLVAVIDIEKLLIPVKEFMRTLDPTQAKGIVLLGEIQDPHNVGAVIRSAAAFGIGAVLIPRHRQAPVTATVAKVSAGAVFKIPLIEVTNVNTTLRQLKEKGYWIYGLDMEGDTSVYTEDFTRPSVLVIGNEGKGIREKTHDLCDSILTIPITATVESLNASVSAAVTMAFWRSKQ